MGSLILGWPSATKRKLAACLPEGSATTIDVGGIDSWAAVEECLRLWRATPLARVVVCTDAIVANACVALVRALARTRPAVAVYGVRPDGDLARATRATCTAQLPLETPLLILTKPLDAAQLLAFAEFTRPASTPDAPAHTVKLEHLVRRSAALSVDQELTAAIARDLSGATAAMRVTTELAGEASMAGVRDAASVAAATTSAYETMGRDAEEATADARARRKDECVASAAGALAMTASVALLGAPVWQVAGALGLDCAAAAVGVPGWSAGRGAHVTRGIHIHLAASAASATPASCTAESLAASVEAREPEAMESAEAVKATKHVASAHGGAHLARPGEPASIGTADSSWRSPLDAGSVGSVVFFGADGKPVNAKNRPPHDYTLSEAARETKVSRAEAARTWAFAERQSRLEKVSAMHTEVVSERIVQASEKHAKHILHRAGGWRPAADGISASHVLHGSTSAVHGRDGTGTGAKRAMAPPRAGFNERMRTQHMVRVNLNTIPYIDDVGPGDMIRGRAGDYFGDMFERKSKVVDLDGKAVRGDRLRALRHNLDRVDASAVPSRALPRAIGACASAAGAVVALAGAHQAYTSCRDGDGGTVAKCLLQIGAEIAVDAAHAGVGTLAIGAGITLIAAPAAAGAGSALLATALIAGGSDLVLRGPHVAAHTAHHATTAIFCP